MNTAILSSLSGELPARTNISDAIFCHSNGFIAPANSLNGIIELAN